MRLKFVFALAILNMLVGCVATQEDVRGVYGRQGRLEAKTEQLSQDIEALKRGIQALNDREAREEEQITQVEERLGSTEQVYSELKKRLDGLEGKGPTSSLPSVSQPEEGAATTSEFESEANVFNEGYKDLGEGNYKEARESFKLFLSKYPDSSKSPDALYWIAESYYREGKFEEAILEFQRFIDTYPKDSRVPLSYLKQGFSLINIGRKEEARLFLQTLIDKFPESEEAKMAREKLKELAREG